MAKKLFEIFWTNILLTGTQGFVMLLVKRFLKRKNKRNIIDGIGTEQWISLLSRVG
jgi:hypothetical protein